VEKFTRIKVVGEASRILSYEIAEQELVRFV
jgi:hypothetical protein